MNEPEHELSCIEVTFTFGGRVCFSVAGYANPDRLLPDEAFVVRKGPKVEELTTEGYRVNFGRIRIFDWELYDAQMREMIGLGPRPDGWLTRAGS